ncbi:DNA alkylation repair protein [bacterium]|nr:DNA alkylation repair protein [bacterium]
MSNSEFAEIIRNKLLEDAEKNYKVFSASLIPNINNVLGIRVPKLREIAKAIYVSNFREDYLKYRNCQFMEETMLQGMVIGMLDYPPEKILDYIASFIPRIDNWAVCDIFCSGLKFTKKNKKLIWNFINPYFYSEKEFEIRFATVMALDYFVEKDYLDKIFTIFQQIKSDDYYAKMAVAWAISVCAVKFPDETFDYLKQMKLTPWIHNKSIQKCIESFRISDEMKHKLRKLKI